MGFCFSKKSTPPSIPIIPPDWTLQDYHNGKELPEYIPPVTMGKVIKVYDGDTITLAAPLHGTMYKFHVRLLGIDTAEIRGTTGKSHSMAILARDQLQEMIMNQVVTLEQVTLEKYGRLLANVIFQDLNISEWLVATHLAVRYDGKKKQDESIWDTIYDTHWQTI